MDFLDTIIKLCNISEEDKDFLVKNLFKYKDNFVINTTCSIIQEHSKNNAIFFNTLLEINPTIPIPSVCPLIIFSPDNLNTLRVFPNILLNNGNSDFSSITSSNYNPWLTSFIEEYENDIAHDKRKQKWENNDTVEKYLNAYLDMPTARALTRYVFPNDALKADQIRDLANAIDIFRKPLELTFVETPEDFVTMYGSGP